MRAASTLCWRMAGACRVLVRAKLLTKIVCNRQPRLARSTVGCYHARIVLSNIDCGIRRSRFFNTNSCPFNDLQRCRAPTIKQKTFGKLRHSILRTCFCIVGPPPGTAWPAQWHDILYEWNMRVGHWSHVSAKVFWTQYWNFASYIANLHAEHWVRRHLPGNRVQHIPPADTHNKLGT